jgi:hypothetical protein
VAESTINVLAQLAQILIGAFVPVAVAFLVKKLGLDSEKNANLVLQNAVANKAGDIVTDILAKKYTIDDVKDGHVTNDLMAYLATTAKDSIARVGLTPATATTMLVGKVLDKMTPAAIVVTPPSN